MLKATLIYFLAITVNLSLVATDDSISDISTLTSDIGENTFTEKFTSSLSESLITEKISESTLDEDTSAPTIETTSKSTSSENLPSSLSSLSLLSSSSSPSSIEAVSLPESTKDPPQNASQVTTTTEKNTESTASKSTTSLPSSSSSSLSPSSSEKSLIDTSDRGGSNYEPATARKDDNQENTKKRKSTNKQSPSVDELISGIIQLIGGNVKLRQPQVTPRPQVMQNMPVMIPYSPPRLNNRGPPAFVGGPGGGVYANGNDGGSHNLPPNILIGPGPIGLPLPTSGFGQQSGQYSNQHNHIIPLQFPPQQPHHHHQQQQQQQPPQQSPPRVSPPTDIAPSRPVNVQDSSSDNGDSNELIYNPIKRVPQDRHTNTPKEPTIKHSNQVSDNHYPPSTNNPVKDDNSSASSTITTTSKTLVPTYVENMNNKKNESLSMLEASLENHDTSLSNSYTTPEIPEKSTASSVNSNNEPMSNSPVTAWVPFFVESSAGEGKVIPSSWSEEPPQIITKPEEPSTFDITVKHKIGPDNSKPLTYPKISSTKTYTFNEATLSTASSTQSSSSTSSSSTSSSLPSRLLNTTTASSSNSGQSTSINSTPTRTRILNRHTEIEPDIVYGRPLDKNNVYGKRRPTDQASSIVPSFAGRPSRPYQISSTKEILDNPVMSTRTTPLPDSPSSSSSSSSSILGKPVVIPVEMDDVRPAFAGIGGTNQATPQVITEPGHGSVFIDGKPTYFKIRPNKPSQPTLHVGSGMTVNAADSDSGNLGVGHLKPIPVNGLPSNKNQLASSKPAHRRPPFRPRPNTPLVRIDTCIVGDDSTCGANLNEHCKTEIGISSCQCKPGFGRTTARGMCLPISSLVMFLRLDKLDNKKIIFNRKLTDPDTEEFQYLEYESLQALNSLFSSSRLGKVFKGVKINKFYSMAGKTLVNATIELDKSNITRSSNIKRIVQQELIRVISSRNNKLGDSTLSVDESANAIPRIEDINECANSDLNDCSKFAGCYNEFGGYRCVCKPGYDDKYAKDPVKSGRQCASCSPSYCSNRGECLIVNGERECRCRGNFIGSKCDIDGEVVGVAVGGSLAAIVIIVITFICLYMWNQRWKREQQKMEAMSAGSGQTFSYVNKAQNVANYRCINTIDDRTRWATMTQTLPVNANYNYYVNPEHLMTTSHQPFQQQQHLYATPTLRAQTPDALISDEHVDSRHYTRPARSKSRSSLAPGYQTMGYAPGNIYNETEFSTREALYSPRVILPPRPKYSSYN